MTQDLNYYFDLVKNFNKQYNDLLDAYEKFEKTNKPIEDKDTFDFFNKIDDIIENKKDNLGPKILHPSTLIKPFEGFIDEVKMICALYLDKVINENVFKVFKPTIQEIIDDNIINKVHTALDIPYKEEHYSIIYEALAIYPLPPIYNHNLYNL